MKNPTLKTYCQRKFNQYFGYYYPNEERYHWNVRRIIFEQGDYDLAVIAQTMYYANDQIETANKLSKITGLNFKTKKSFLKTGNKYTTQFNSLIKNRKNAKISFKRKINTIIKKKNLTLYKISKLYGFNKAKLYAFLMKESTMFSLLCLYKKYITQ